MAKTPRSVPADNVEEILFEMSESSGGGDLNLDDLIRRLEEAHISSMPTSVPFTYYLHEDSDEEMTEFLAEQTGIPESHPVWKKVGRPFYEVALHCSLNTETGAVTVLEVKL